MRVHVHVRKVQMRARNVCLVNKSKKNITMFHLKIVIFTHSMLHRHVDVTKRLGKCMHRVHDHAITKTSPCNEHPLTPHFYIVKLGFTGVYVFFSYFCSKT